MNLYDFYQAKLEYSTEAIATDKQLATHIQEILIWLGFLNPPADGHFGPIATNALIEFQEVMSQKIPELSEEKGFLGNITAKLLTEISPDKIPKPELNLGNDLAGRIIKYMQHKGYQIATKPGEYNIVYVEGMDTDEKLNDNKPNCFNDIRVVIEIQNGIPKIIGCWEATTEPGAYYTYKPINSEGSARILFGQYKAWRVGQCGISEPHEAIIQVENITVCRDFNKDFRRIGDRIETGLFGINQHWGYDLPRNNINMSSAGSLVGRTRNGHREFMQIIKQDKRYKKNPNYLFLTTVISGDDLEKQFPPVLANEVEKDLSSNGFKTQQQSLPAENSATLILNQLSAVSKLTSSQAQETPEAKKFQETLSKMNPEQQLELVKKYLQALLVYCSENSQ